MLAFELCVGSFIFGAANFFNFFLDELPLKKLTNSHIESLSVVGPILDFARSF